MDVSECKGGNGFKQGGMIKMAMNTYKIGELYSHYCADCDEYTTQVYKGVYGGESHMFLCKECGCENCDEIDIRKYPE